MLPEPHHYRSPLTSAAQAQTAGRPSSLWGTWAVKSFVGALHMRLRRLGLLLTVGGLLALAGCQSPPPKSAAIPPSISMFDQLVQLNARAAALDTLRVVGSLKLHYLDRHGNAQNYQAHAVLLIDQNIGHPARHAGGALPRAELLLVATYLGQNMFEFGMNAQHYWAIDHHNKVAWVGSREQPNTPLRRAMPLGPRNILDLLAITPLLPTSQAPLAMTVSNHPPQNRIFVIRAGADGAAQIQRQVVISRLTGLVQGVLMFDRSGKRIATAVLSDYHRIAARNATVTAASPRFPFRIAIDNPLQHSQLRLTVQSASLTLRVKPRYAFASPSLEGLKVYNLDSAASGSPGR
ncbi:MAG: hypothetical protein HKL96_04605 [Phycisphaerales bacterium]|nr:hypothetical protein [Phycisphaerales bacterium]